MGFDQLKSLNYYCRSQGIVFSVRPPKKSWKNIANLSGGEKTLSSLSLVFALHHYKPTPLYVMDEIDAALGAKSPFSSRMPFRHMPDSLLTVPGCIATWASCTFCRCLCTLV